MSQSVTDQLFLPIIGRPNVGKSTLFNSLIGEDRAITGSEPGVTRDRISEDLEWDDRTITLIDTAGYQSDQPADDEFVIDQIKSMIDLADSLIFVVDSEDGVTALDRKIAELLHSSDTRVILTVNKVDPGRDPETYKSSFYELGFEEVIPVSAIHGDGLKNLKQTAAQYLPDRSITLPTEGIRLSLVGRPNVGKSTLLNSILGYDRVMVSEEPGTTRDMVSVSFDVGDQRFHMMDTGGMKPKQSGQDDIEVQTSKKGLRAINFSDVVCLVLDWEQRVTKQDQRIAGLIKDRYRGCIILVNKADEPDESVENRWLEHIRERLYFMDYAPILFTSGMERRGLESIFSLAGEIYGEMHHRFDPDELTNAMLDVKTEISWPGQNAGEVIIVSLEQVDLNPIHFEVVAREPERLSERDIRHFDRLLRSKLDIGISPIKLNFISEEEPSRE